MKDLGLKLDALCLEHQAGRKRRERVMKTLSLQKMLRCHVISDSTSEGDKRVSGEREEEHNKGD